MKSSAPLLCSCEKWDFSQREQIGQSHNRDIVSTEENDGRVIALVIVAGSVSSAVLVGGEWSASKETESAEMDACYRRRVFIRMA